MNFTLKEKKTPGFILGKCKEHLERVIEGGHTGDDILAAFDCITTITQMSFDFHGLLIGYLKVHKNDKTALNLLSYVESYRKKWEKSSM